MAVDVTLQRTLEEMDEKYGGEEMFRIFGPTSLSWSTTDSSRMYMFTSHLKQTLTLLEPDIPHLATGMENSIGKYNQAYKRLKGTWEVKAIIPKFSIPDSVGDEKERRAIQIYTVVFYNKKTNTYEMIEKPVAENLTEKFGYAYNSEFMDELEVGKKITDAVIFKSTSYDKNMNYRYGKNARVYYSTSTDTIEDALVIRRGWAEHVKSVEVDEITVPINDNDVLLNLYGEGDDYRGFPEIGQPVKDSLICATRRINKSHLIYDFENANIKEVMDTDADYYTSKHSVIYDIDVYYNSNNPFPDNRFFRQLKRYYDDCCNYAAEILKWCNYIKKESGSNYTQNVSFFRSKYLHWNDPDYAWRGKEKKFGNIIVVFKIKSVNSLDLGSKLSGRFGNKGVISRIMNDPSKLDISSAVVDMLDKDHKMSEEERRILMSQVQIVDDERMPYYLQDGERVYVDVLCNASGAIRR